jgi:hypothetical protein
MIKLPKVIRQRHDSNSPNSTIRQFLLDRGPSDTQQSAAGIERIETALRLA